MKIIFTRFTSNFSGTKNALSKNILVVLSVIDESKPPITPAIARAFLSSAIIKVSQSNLTCV